MHGLISEKNVFDRYNDMGSEKQFCFLNGFSMIAA